MFAHKLEANENSSVQIAPINEGIASAARELLNNNTSYKALSEAITGRMVNAGVIPELTIDLGMRSPVQALRAGNFKREIDPPVVSPLRKFEQTSYTHKHEHCRHVEPGVINNPAHDEKWGKRTFSVAVDGSAKYLISRGDTLSSISADILSRKHKDDPGWKLTTREMFDTIRELAKANQIKNPDLIFAGKDLKVPAELLTGKGKQTPHHEPERVPQKGHEPERRPERRPESEKPRVKDKLLEVHNTSPEFQKRVEKELESMDPKVRQLLEKNGYKVIAAKSVTDIRPDLKGVVPRGYPPGFSWDNADGLQDSDKKQIIVTENLKVNGVWTKSARTEGVLRHETAHAVDVCLGKFSSSEQFKKAYEADIAKIPPADRAKLAYLLQPGNAGRSEAFAEVLAAMNGKYASAGPEMRALIRKYFTGSEAQIKERMAKL